MTETRICKLEGCGAPFVIGTGRGANKRRYCCAEHACEGYAHRRAKQALAWYHANREAVLDRMAAKRGGKRRHG